MAAWVKVSTNIIKAAWVVAAWVEVDMAAEWEVETLVEVAWEAWVVGTWEEWAVGTWVEWVVETWVAWVAWAVGWEEWATSQHILQAAPWFALLVLACMNIICRGVDLLTVTAVNMFRKQELGILLLFCSGIQLQEHMRLLRVTGDARERSSDR